MWGNSIGGSLFKENLYLFCETLYRVDADVLFVGVLHLIHYSRPAREIVESESIQKDHDRACCSTELSVNYRLTSRLHASKKQVISLYCSGLCFIQIAAINAVGVPMYQSVNLIFV